jgi:hypothetical protein
MRPIFCFVMTLMAATSASSVSASSQKWVTSWTASAQRPLGQLAVRSIRGVPEEIYCGHHSAAVRWRAVHRVKEDAWAAGDH